MLTRKALKSLASDSSFSRGVTYFHQGSVGKIKREGNTFKAKVHGTYTYKTKLTLRAAGPELHCNCPYDFGGICKHAVALGLAVMEEFGSHSLQMVAEPDTGPAALEKALEVTPAAEQLQFLANLLRNDAKLRRQFLRAVEADDEATPTAPQIATPAETTPESISTEVYEALSDLEFDDDLLRGYTDYYGDYLDDESDGMLGLADEAIKEVLAPHAQAVAAAVRGRRLHAALRRWVGVYEGSAAAENPQADDYDLFSYEGYPARVLNCWEALLDEEGVSQQLENEPFSPGETKAGLTLLFDRYPAGLPAHFADVLLRLAHDLPAAVLLGPLLAA